MRRPIALVMLASLAVACGGRQGGPQRALGEYSRALERRDYDRAYELMSEAYRSQHSKEDFVRMLEENPREVKETASRLRSARGDLDVTAELRYGLGDRMQLVREGGDWKIASNPVDFYSQATPREALRSFLRAYSLKRWDILLRLAPKTYRERMTAESVRDHFEGEHKEDLARMMAMIGANVEEPIAEQGNDALLRYGENEIRFVREDNAWKIKDLD
jgi:hypothetical protein